MAGLFQEHDALIVAAAMGILERTGKEASRDSLTASGHASRDLARCSEACARASESVFHALSIAGIYANDEHAAAAVSRAVGREREPAGVPA